MFCSKCGSKLGESEKFCRVCGTPAGPEQGQVNQPGQQYQNYNTPNPQYQNNNAQTPQYQNYNTPAYTQPPVQYNNMQYANVNTGAAKNNKNIIIIGAIAAVVVIIGVILVIVLSSSAGKPSDVVKKFVNAINNKDMNAMISCIDPLTAKDIAIDDFQEFVEADAKITITKILSETESGDSAVVVATTVIVEKDSKGKTNTDSGDATFTLEKISGQWKITNIE